MLLVFERHGLVTMATTLFVLITMKSCHLTGHHSNIMHYLNYISTKTNGECDVVVSHIGR